MTTNTDSIRTFSVRLRLERFFDILRKQYADRLDADITLLAASFAAGGLFVSFIGAVAVASQKITGLEWRWLWGDFFAWLEGFAQNFSTEMIGVVITFVLLEVLLDQKRRNEANEREKERLILQLGSSNNAFAVEAARQLRARGWLQEPGIPRVKLPRANMKGVNLRDANMEGAYLSEANLERVDFRKANLTGVYLISANLERARLTYAMLHGAFLQEANLREARLSYAQLEEAFLQGANLEQAVMKDTNLQGAHLKDAILKGAKSLTIDQLQSAHTLQGAILPDGTELPHNHSWAETFEKWVQQQDPFI